MAEHSGHKHHQAEGGEHPPSESSSGASELERIFDEVFSQRWPRAWLRRFHWDEPAWGELGPLLGPHPRVRVFEQAEQFLVRAQLPGLRKDQLEIFVEQTRVIIRGRSTRHARAESDEYYRSHTSLDEFTRTVELPGPVDGARASARITDGVLEITLPRADLKKRYRIEISD